MGHGRGGTATDARLARCSSARWNACERTDNLVQVASPKRRYDFLANGFPLAPLISWGTADYPNLVPTAKDKESQRLVGGALLLPTSGQEVPFGRSFCCWNFQRLCLRHRHVWPAPFSNEVKLTRLRRLLATFWEVIRDTHPDTRNLNIHEPPRRYREHIPARIASGIPPVRPRDGVSVSLFRIGCPSFRLGCLRGACRRSDTGPRLG